MNGEAKEPPMHADGRRYGERDEQRDQCESLPVDARDLANRGIYFQLRDGNGRELARFRVPEVNPQEEEIKVVFTNRGKGIHTLYMDWLPMTMMIPGWRWNWWKIRREFRHELRNLWRMLRR